MNCHPTGSPEIILTYIRQKNARNNWDYKVIGENRPNRWLSDKQFAKHFKKLI